MNQIETAMTTEIPGTDSQNAAWASIATPLSFDELLSFCKADLERLLRINPHIEVKRWEKIGDESYSYRFKNSSQEQPFELDLELQVKQETDGLTVHYSKGLKQSTRFMVESDPLGSKLSIIENYSSPDEQPEIETNMSEIDKSLTIWARDLQLYLMRWKRWSRIAPWRWYMRYVWMPMKPAGRRITYMLLWISLVEVSLIALGIAIYFAEYH